MATAHVRFTTSHKHKGAKENHKRRSPGWVPKLGQPGAKGAAVKAWRAEASSPRRTRRPARSCAAGAGLRRQGTPHVKEQLGPAPVLEGRKSGRQEGKGRPLPGLPAKRGGAEVRRRAAAGNSAEISHCGNRGRLHGTGRGGTGRSGRRRRWNPQIVFFLRTPFSVQRQ